MHAYEIALFVHFLGLITLNGTALGIVWVMTMKPAWLGAVGVVVVATALGAVVGSTMVRRGPGLLDPQGDPHERTAG